MNNGQTIGLIVLIVTYGSKKRYPSLLKTIQSAIDAGAKYIFIVGNGTTYDLDLALSDQEKIEVLNFSKNRGSAFGFTHGIKAIIGSEKVTDDDYILILDDDVIVRKNLLQNIASIRKSEFSDETVWSLLRVGRDTTFSQNYDKTLATYHNTIAAFSVFSNKRTLKIRDNKQVAELAFAPWAGFLLTKTQLKKIKLPSTDYFVYVDDQAFSLEVQRAGFVIRRSALLALDEGSTSWFQSKEGTPESGYRAYYRSEKEPGRFLYKIRNDVFFISREGFITSKFKYFLNVVIYITAGFIKYAPKSIQGFIRFNHLIKAIKQGLSGELGEDRNWTL